MHSIITLLPLLAFGTIVCAAPLPRHLETRSVPKLHEVARDPAPIDGIKIVEGALTSVFGHLTSTTTGLGHRAVPKVETKIAQPGNVVGRRATPKVEHTIAQPGDVTGSA